MEEACTVRVSETGGFRTRAGMGTAVEVVLDGRVLVVFLLGGRMLMEAVLIARVLGEFVLGQK